MAKDAIRFHKIDSDPELVAVAEVSLFSGVYLRGWYILERGGQIEVLPPPKDQSFQPQPPCFQISVYCADFQEENET